MSTQSVSSQKRDTSIEVSGSIMYHRSKRSTRCLSATRLGRTFGASILIKRLNTVTADSISIRTNLRRRLITLARIRNVGGRFSRQMITNHGVAAPIEILRTGRTARRYNVVPFQLASMAAKWTPGLGYLPEFRLRPQLVRFKFL